MELSFKSKVRERLVEGALNYSKLLNYFFVFESRQFQFQKSYSLRFTEENYKHLTGVTTKLSVRVFFEKCLNGTIKIDDFDCEDTKRRKGLVRNKTKHLAKLEEIVTDTIAIEERFVHGRVIALFAVSNGRFTLAFTGGHVLNLMSLLDGIETHRGKEIKDFKISKQMIIKK